MTLHRPRRPYSPAYARRRLAAITAQIDSLRRLDCLGDWRLACDKRRKLDSLEAQQAKWQNVLTPPPVPQHYPLPF